MQELLTMIWTLVLFFLTESCQWFWFQWQWGCCITGAFSSLFQVIWIQLHFEACIFEFYLWRYSIFCASYVTCHWPLRAFSVEIAMCKVSKLLYLECSRPNWIKLILPYLVCSVLFSFLWLKIGVKYITLFTGCMLILKAMQSILWK